MGGADKVRNPKHTETEGEGTCEQSVARGSALLCKARVWNSVTEAYKHMPPHRQHYKLSQFQGKKKKRVCAVPVRPVQNYKVVSERKLEN